MHQILKTGYLKKRKNGKPNETKQYAIARLNEKHLSLVMDLQQVIIQNLQRPDLLQSFSEEFMKEHLGPRGLVLGVFVEQELAAFRNIYYPDKLDREWNLGIDIGLSKSERHQVANLQMVCVHPRFRGNSLAMKLNRIALSLLREKGTHHHVCATVSPYNIWNLPVLLANGFHVAELKQKYGGKTRYIVYQNLHKQQLFEDSDRVEVPLDNLDTQEKLLDAGYLGTALVRGETVDQDNPVKNFKMVFSPPAYERTEKFHLQTPYHWLPDQMGAIDTPCHCANRVFL